AAAAAVVIVGGAVVGIPVHADGPPGCLQPISTDSRAQCDLDIWGYVTYANGAPASHVSVTDHAGGVTATDSSGLYDFQLEVPGSYTLAVSTTTGCFTSKAVDHNLAF